MAAIADNNWSNWEGSTDSGSGHTGQRPSVAFVLAVSSPLALAPQPGTGGMMTIAALHARPGWISIDSTTAGVAGLDEQGSNTQASETLQQRLQMVKTTLGLTITDMAGLFGVARPSIYAWLSGQEPRPENVERLAEFESAAERVGALALPRIDKLIKRPLKSGDTLFSLIRDGRSLNAPLDELSAVASAELSQRLTQKGRHALSSAREAADQVSTHGVLKDA